MQPPAHIEPRAAPLVHVATAPLRALVVLSGGQGDSRVGAALGAVLGGDLVERLAGLAVLERANRRHADQLVATSGVVGADVASLVAHQVLGEDPDLVVAHVRADHLHPAAARQLVLALVEQNVLGEDQLNRERRLVLELADVDGDILTVTGELLHDAAGLVGRGRLGLLGRVAAVAAGRAGCRQCDDRRSGGQSARKLRAHARTSMNVRISRYETLWTFLFYHIVMINKI